MQQVNLYAAQFPAGETIKVSRKASFIVIVVVVAIISAISVGYWKIEALQKEYEQYKKTASISQQALDKVKAELNKSADDDKLKVDLLNIKEKLKHKQALKDRISRESTDISVSYYDRLAALSNQDIKGLWLNKIEFTNNDETITLSGNSSNPDLFTRYLQHLSKEPVFSGITFKVLNISGYENDNKPAKNKNESIHFVISTDVIPTAVEEMLGAPLQ